MNTKSHKWIKTLNVTDAATHTNGPHCGSIGHVLPFPDACLLAGKFGFDAVNADREFIINQGPEYTAGMMKEYDLVPGAFAFSAAFNACYTNAEFEQSLSGFERDLDLCGRAGFDRCVGFVQPSSDTCSYHTHFTLLKSRLQCIKPMLKDYEVRLGLEFIGPSFMRRRKRFDFIHTLDGVRCLISAADAEAQAGIKLDAMHWYASGAGVLDIEKLAPEEVVYVELNDGLSGAYNRFTLPEFERELPGKTGIIPISDMLFALQKIGFNGPVVVEPWNRSIRELAPEVAVKKVKNTMDEILESTIAG